MVWLGSINSTATIKDGEARVGAIAACVIQQKSAWVQQMLAPHCSIFSVQRFIGCALYSQATCTVLLPLKLTENVEQY